VRLSRPHRETRIASSTGGVWTAGVPLGSVGVASGSLLYATVGQSVTHRQERRNAVWSKSVTIYLNGIHYNDATIYPDASG
jgi:hypothetical protein